MNNSLVEKKLKQIIEMEGYKLNDEIMLKNIQKCQEFTDKYLTDKAKKVLAKKYTESKILDKHGDEYRSVIFSQVVENNNEEKCFVSISKLINKLVESDLIYGTLSQVSILKGPVPIMFCSLLLSYDRKEEITEIYKTLALEEHDEVLQ